MVPLRLTRGHGIECQLEQSQCIMHSKTRGIYLSPPNSSAEFSVLVGVAGGEEQPRHGQSPPSRNASTCKTSPPSHVEPRGGFGAERFPRALSPTQCSLVSTTTARWMTTGSTRMTPPSPHTNRRNMLSTEIPESLRHHLLWERSQTSLNAYATLKQPHTRTASHT